MASVIFGIIYFFFNFQFDFNLSLRDGLLITFFTCIGLSTRMKELVEGGKPLLILFLLATVFIFLQNILGIYVMKLFGQNPAIGILGGSIALQGGHGTVIAWADIFKSEYGVETSMEIGIAVATFGLVFGGLVGGPTARYLIRKNDLKPTDMKPIMVGKQYGKKLTIDYDSVLSILLILAFSIGLGIYIDKLLKLAGINLPLFVSTMFGGMLLSNLTPILIPKTRSPAGSPTLAVISDISLGLFIAMSLMSLQLWLLVEQALPLITLFALQVLMMVLFIIFILFRALGKNYDAAVISAGYIGSGLGATPTAMVNMSAVTKAYGPSHVAFIIIPIVGAFFIHISNSIIVQAILEWLF
jgi:ESS family glutamate:Na+ symporter